MRISYDQARQDHEYLWAINPAYDMTGGYVDQVDLDILLKSPTKRTAAEVYCEQIQYWFQVGPDTQGDPGIPSRQRDQLLRDDPEVRAIAIRHGLEELVPGYFDEDDE